MVSANIVLTAYNGTSTYSFGGTPTFTLVALNNIINLSFYTFSGKITSSTASGTGTYTELEGTIDTSANPNLLPPGGGMNFIIAGTDSSSAAVNILMTLTQSQTSTNNINVAFTPAPPTTSFDISTSTNFIILGTSVCYVTPTPSSGVTVPAA